MKKHLKYLNKYFKFYYYNEGIFYYKFENVTISGSIGANNSVMEAEMTLELIMRELDEYKITYK